MEQDLEIAWTRLNPNSWFLFSLQMADCGGMPQVDQVCIRLQDRLYLFAEPGDN